MTVREIKDSLKNYKTEDLYKIIVELYKRKALNNLESFFVIY